MNCTLRDSSFAVLREKLFTLLQKDVNIRDDLTIFKLHIGKFYVKISGYTTKTGYITQNNNSWLVESAGWLSRETEGLCMILLESSTSLNIYIQLCLSASMPVCLITCNTYDNTTQQTPQPLFPHTLQPTHFQLFVGCESGEREDSELLPDLKRSAESLAPC